jgi:hypothetical protein
MPFDAYERSPWQVMLGRRSDVGGQALAPSMLLIGARAGEAEAAIAHWRLPESGNEGVMRHDGSGGERKGSVRHAQFRLCGQTFIATDSALDHGFAFTEANSCRSRRTSCPSSCASRRPSG